jgi:hypothetical protein
MIDLVTRDADGIVRHVRAGLGGLDLTEQERRVLRDARFPRFLRAMISIGSGLLFAGFVLALVATALRTEWVKDPAGLLGALGMICVMCGVTWLAMRSIDYKLGDIITDAWLRLGRCPACGFHVGAVEPGDDGAITCPECAARWRLSDEGRQRE